MATNTAKQIGTVLSSVGTKTIGALALWTLSQVRIRRTELEGKLDAIGLGEAMPRAPKPYAVLSSAVERVSRGKRDVLFRRPQAEKAWALLVANEETSSPGKSRHVKMIHVVTLRAEGEGSDAVAAEWIDPTFPPLYPDAVSIVALVKDAFLECRDFVHTDGLSEILTACMSGTGKHSLLAALSLRERTGGIYFVHSTKLPMLRNLADLVRDLGSELNVLTITGQDENLSQAASAAKASFAAQLQTLREDLAELKSKLAANDGTGKERSIEIRAERFRAVEGRVALFADILGDVAGELRAEIEHARQTLLAELG